MQCIQPKILPSLLFEIDVGRVSIKYGMLQRFILGNLHFHQRIAPALRIRKQRRAKESRSLKEKRNEPQFDP